MEDQDTPPSATPPRGLRPQGEPHGGVLLALPHPARRHVRHEPGHHDLAGRTPAHLRHRLLAVQDGRGRGRHCRHCGIGQFHNDLIVTTGINPPMLYSLFMF